MATVLFRSLKAINLSCTSSDSTAICPSISDHRIRSKFTHSPPIYNPSLSTHDPKQPHLLSPASSSRYLLDHDSDDLFDLVPSFSTPTISSSSSFSSSSCSEIKEEAKKKVESEGNVSYLRSEKVSSSSFDGRTGWVRFHTVDGGESAIVNRLARGEPIAKDKMGENDTSAEGLSGCSNMEKVRTFGVDCVEKDRSVALKSASATTTAQVVVLRVSLHCKGCEGKVRKHISRMPGVTSFSIDFATKKVIVIGDLSPLGVLSSISKVKNAQLWPSPSLPPIPSRTPI